MRVAAIYDIHANYSALKTVLEDIRKANIDQVVVGGDPIDMSSDVGIMRNRYYRLIMFSIQSL